MGRTLENPDSVREDAVRRVAPADRTPESEVARAEARRAAVAAASRRFIAAMIDRHRGAADA